MPLKKFLSFFILVTPLFFGGCTSMLLVRSEWNTGKISVDGYDNDWGDTMFYIPSAQLTAGVRNDSKYLYLILKAANRRQAYQIMGLGLTVWFDPSGGTGERLGIHFPIGRDQGQEFQRNNERENTDAGSQQPASFVMRNPNEVELLGANPNGPMRMSIVDLKGIQIQIKNSPDGLVYELRVPLHSSDEDPYAINPKGQEIGIGFVGGKFERPSNMERRRPEGGDEGGEGMPGGEGGEGGEMPGGMEGGGYGERGGYRREQGRRPEAPQQIDFWLRVDLAGGPVQAPVIH